MGSSRDGWEALLPLPGPAATFVGKVNTSTCSTPTNASTTSTASFRLSASPATCGSDTSLPTEPPLSAPDLSALAPASLACTSCRTPIVDTASLGRTSGFKDLPSEHWEELVGSWLCHDEMKLALGASGEGDRPGGGGGGGGSGFWPKEGEVLVGSNYVLVQGALMLGADGVGEPRWRVRVGAEVSPTVRFLPFGYVPILSRFRCPPSTLYLDFQKGRRPISYGCSPSSLLSARLRLFALWTSIPNPSPRVCLLRSQAQTDRKPLAGSPTCSCRALRTALCSMGDRPGKWRSVSAVGLRRSRGSKGRGGNAPVCHYFARSIQGSDSALVRTPLPTNSLLSFRVPVGVKSYRRRDITLHTSLLLSFFPSLQLVRLSLSLFLSAVASPVISTLTRSLPLVAAVGDVATDRVHHLLLSTRSPNGARLRTSHVNIQAEQVRHHFHVS